MSRRIRGGVICLAALAVALGITACMHWFTGPPVPTLIIGPVTIVGNRGEILLSVTDIPGGGLASMAVNVLTGIQFDPAKVANVAVVGLVGFEVLAQQFGVVNPNFGGFLVAHAVTGLPAGDFVKLVFDVTGPTVTLADFTFNQPSIDLGDDTNQDVAYQIRDAYKYYAK
ncbi:hypothetical protein ACFLSF_04340 [Candidatus Bipolaricaulota bacterium]